MKVLLDNYQVNAIKIKEKNVYGKCYTQYINSCQNPFICQHRKYPPSHSTVH